jgi:hypothetical protein
MGVLGAVILVFVFRGMWTGGGRGAPDIVAKVDGMAIKTIDYQNAYRRQLEQSLSIFSGTSMRSQSPSIIARSV